MDNYDNRESRHQMAATLSDGKKFIKAGKDYKFNNMDKNLILLKGHVGKDPDQFAEGKGCRFSIATSENKKVMDKWESVTQWHNIVCFDKLYQQKGIRVRSGQYLSIEGILRYEKWVDGSGTQQTSAKIEAISIDQIVTVK